MVQLRGTLFVYIASAKKLFNADSSFFGLTKNKSDPYVKVTIGETRICKTRIVDDSVNPKWDEYFLCEVCHDGETLDLQVLDKDLIGSEDLGMLQIPLEKLKEKKIIQGEFYLVRNNKKCTGRITLHVQLYSPEDLDTTRSVPNCYFDQHRNCKVTLYQDAGNCTTNKALTDQIGHTPPNAFKDIADMIGSAQKFIYLTGWSVKTSTRLQREDPDSETLGELLIRKADKGLTVLAMIWDEITSTDLTPGLMGTYDQETLKYFEGTKVNCIIASRQKLKNAKDAEDLLESEINATMYTHHQKTVICDVDGERGRRVAAFVGGLDLTCGRYDDTDHHIFKTLETEHKGDFYNASASLEVPECGPRQPWHDIHSKIEGSAARDVMRNFEERWKRQNKHQINQLFTLDQDEFDLSSKQFRASDRWSVQVLRSISDNSVVFEDGGVKKEILMKHTDTIYDNSIHRAYVHHIRRAQHFIYIENQYFLGSCHHWQGSDAKYAVQLIPVELAMRIVEAIEKGKWFGVYVVMPLHPEGDPGSAAIQEILHYQYKTIDMMYRLIAKTLRAVGSDKQPTDYLSFFCLGKQERKEDVPATLPTPQPGSKEAVLRETRRFMIYVHSKMAVFDDEYIIVGSANINQRSMSGKRDTEIAVGACQVNERCSGDSMPNAEVAKFRKSLLIEHTGKLDTYVNSPGEMESMRALREEGKRNWDQYTATGGHPEGHLLLYPFEVNSNDGTVSSEREFFPDTEAKIIGEHGILPEKITT